jgi:hypothetical protein
MNAITTIYADAMVEFRWNATTNQPQWRIVGTPGDNWFDNTITYAKPNVAREFITDGGDVLTTLNDWYYFTDSGLENTFFDAENYGGCYTFSLHNESTNIAGYHGKIWYGYNLAYAKYSLEVIQP